MTGDREKAKEFYGKAIFADKSDMRPKINLAVVEYKEGNFIQSAELIKTVAPENIKNEPQSLIQYNILKNSLKAYLQ